MDDSVLYVSSDKLRKLQEELKNLRDEKIPTIAKRIDDARQMGDLSENAEYHAAREEMAWVQSRVLELEYIIQNAQIISEDVHSGTINIGSTFTVEVNGKNKDFTIVGGQEADPFNGKISNESPLGMAFLGKKKGDVVEVKIPAGVQKYKIVKVQ